MPDKCKIISIKRPRQKTISTAIVRVASENYDAIQDLCDETGRGVREITDTLLEYALKRVEITEG